MVVLTQQQKRFVLDGNKIAWHKDRVRAWQQGERVAPITIDMSLTRSCNLSCYFCYSMLQENTIHPLTEDILLRFADDCAEIGVKGISMVSDGESTVSKHWPSFAKRVKKNGMDIAIATNGLLLQPEKNLEILSQFDYIRFNMSAGTPEAYERIMGAKPGDFERFKNIVRFLTDAKRKFGFETTIALQHVLMPEEADQIIPITQLGIELGCDYVVHKHTSDDENHQLGVDYKKYFGLADILAQAESMTTPETLIAIKWSKILSNGLRSYNHCYGPPLILQMSGSGLVAPCGMLFNDKYKRYHIGHITETPFKEIWASERYWQVMRELADSQFDPRSMCGSLCLQHKVNETLYEMKHNGEGFESTLGKEKPLHINFI